MIRNTLELGVEKKDGRSQLTSRAETLSPQGRAFEFKC